jgi:hypothetical protein
LPTIEDVEAKDVVEANKIINKELRAISSYFDWIRDNFTDFNSIWMMTSYISDDGDSAKFDIVIDNWMNEERIQIYYNDTEGFFDKELIMNFFEAANEFAGFVRKQNIK